MRIVQIAAFRGQKDQDCLIRAAQLLPTEYEVSFVGDGERREECEQLALSLGLADRIHFMGIQSNIPGILKEMDIVVMSSHWEGFGLAAVEGMAAGKPVIASDVDGLREIVGDAGVLFPPGDEEALAAEILKLSEDETYYCEVASRCRRRADEFDISKMVQEYENVYKEILNTK